MAEKGPKTNTLRTALDLGYSILRPRMSLDTYNEKDDFIAISSLSGLGLGVSLWTASGLIRVGANIAERLTGNEYPMISDVFFYNPVETVGGFMACGVAISTYYAFARRYDNGEVTPNRQDLNDQQ